MNPFIEEVKKNAGIPSDYALAKALGVSKEVVSRWSTRKSDPSGINTLKLAQLGNIETKRAIELMEGGYSSVLLLFVTAILSLCYITRCYEIFYYATMYIMLNLRKLKIKANLLFWSIK